MEWEEYMEWEGTWSGRIHGVEGLEYTHSLDSRTEQKQLKYPQMQKIVIR